MAIYVTLEGKIPRTPRTKQFTIKKTEGMAFLTPFSNRDLQEDVVLTIKDRYRWSDFYILIALNDSIGLPEESIESIFIVPTFMFTAIEEKQKCHLSDLVTKAEQINISKLSKKIQPISMPLLSWACPESINKLFRLHILFLLDKYQEEIIKHRTSIEELKRVAFKEKTKQVQDGTGEFSRRSRATI
ncbi:hypothetical protein [Aliivibrio salmonicida]|uniref:hypothetical protein n=2 Tax=Aliivibrio salmonicida TaxID=40269 RepID=UPI0013ED8EDC|nr:hypothetical protein [Aliivibrio salmonicida]